MASMVSPLPSVKRNGMRQYGNEDAVANRTDEIKELAEGATTNKKKLADLVKQLSGASRRERQIAASALHLVAKADAARLVDYTDVIIDALNRPEAQTRWECLETLTLMIEHDSRTCGKAIPEAESALFDEESGPVRLAAMRFLCALGKTTAARSEKVWPLIDEGIQCYHGDLEFNDMLVAITEFSTGKLSGKVKAELKERMSFDAENGKGSLKRKAQAIIDNVS